ncbi:LssY C-terminal domain-containing protein [Corynebacterium sphenisci]|uniref:LssY C-terminal domain-containing protein n=1 Tax=Corynebacterium sphenisci TaxID=191493 RepID=UPI0009FD9744|nr:LssY C-terminal domain-containing protein [Corynebacterium sphenisci]
MTQSTDRGTERVFDTQVRGLRRGARIDMAFFILAGIESAWFAVLLFAGSFVSGWALLLLIPFWAVTAYLTLPRLHRILTSIYVPDYFFGRTRTSEGMLGDPVNLAVDGTAAQIHAAMTAAGWHLADDVDLRSSWRIVVATVLRRSYPTAPVSPLLLFGRTQDLAYQQEVDGNPLQRHHVRFWRCPDDWPLPGGRRVGWLGAGSFDTAVGLSLFTLQITHRIDADIDVERDHIIDTLREGPAEIPVDVIEDFSTGYHHRNGGGDRVRTDGDLPVIDVTGIDAEPVAAGEDASPHQVVRAARGYDIPDGPSAEPDPGAPPDESEVTIAGATVRRPWTVKLALAMLVISLVAQVWALVRAILRGDPTPAAVTGTASGRVPEELIGAAMWAIGAGLVITAALMVLAYVGYQWPRVLLMGLLTVLLGFKLLDGTMPDAGTLTVHLLITAVSLVALLALSSDAARVWSRRGRPTWRDIAELFER